MNEIREETQQKFSSLPQPFKVLRQKKDDKPLNVSFTTQGLKWTQNKTGRFVYFDKSPNFNIKPSNAESGDILTFEGKNKIDRRLYIEDYVPKNHSNSTIQKFEIVWLDKAIRLLYLK